MIKFLLFVLALTVVNSTKKVEVNENRIKEFATECGRELSLSSDDIELFLKDRWSNPERHSCVTRCIYRKIGFIDENGRVLLGEYDNAIPEHDTIRKTMAECQHVVVATCPDVLKLLKCNKDASEKMKKASTPKP